MKYFTCPVCGGEVKMKAKACPHCGSDENTGWSENTYLDGIDLYDEEDYQETIRREFGIQKNRMNKKQLFITIVAGGVLVLFLLKYVFRL